MTPTLKIIKAQHVNIEPLKRMACSDTSCLFEAGQLERKYHSMLPQLGQHSPKSVVQINRPSPRQDLVGVTPGERGLCPSPSGSHRRTCSSIRQLYVSQDSNVVRRALGHGTWPTLRGKATRVNDWAKLVSLILGALYTALT